MTVVDRSPTKLAAFLAYDVRGRVPDLLDEDPGPQSTYLDLRPKGRRPGAERGGCYEHD